MNGSLNSNIHNGVSFFTNCYEADWKFMLNEGGLRNLIDSCHFEFDFKGLIVNNVNSRSEVEEAARKAVAEKIIDGFYFSQDFAAEILSAYHIGRSSFVLDFYDGYWYSMGPFTAMHLCKTDYLVYFTSDCLMQPNASPAWIGQARKIFESNDRIFVANPLWNANVKEAEEESVAEELNWYFSQGFSDQCFMLPVRKVRGPFYGHQHPGSEMFPIYAGNTFERRLDSYMRVSGQQRITHKSISYTHDNEIRQMESGPKPFLKVIKRVLADLKKDIRVRARQLIEKRHF